MNFKFQLNSIFQLGLPITGVVLLLLLVSVAGAQGPQPQDTIEAQAALGTAFTYQGELTNASSPVTGACNFQFSLWDAPAAGAEIGSTQIANGLNLVNGRFTVQLDFGDSAFSGDARWLQIAVQCGGDNGFTTLSPRQALTPGPYALALPGLWTQPNATSPNLIGGYSGNSVTSGAVGATIGGGGASAAKNRVTDDYGTVGGGRGNRAGDNAGTTSDNVYAATAGGRDNFASGSYSTIGGGHGNLAAADYATIGGGGRTNPNILGTGNRVGDNYGTVGGGGNNQAGDGDADPTNARYATVGGGHSNTASGRDATVGGGSANYASGPFATVGGGSANYASGEDATIGGGEDNTASDRDATVGGGEDNTASGGEATVGGGQDNTASGPFATVPGGLSASASHYGEMAYASGRFASSGDAQTSVYVLRNTTTNATPTDLFLDGFNDRLTIVPAATLVFDILVVARSSGDSSAGYVMRGIIENDDGWTHFIGVPSVIATGEDRADWDVAVTADNANDALVITVTGEAGYTIRWVATVRTVEVWHQGQGGRS